MSYANGRYPLNLFIHRGDNIYLTPSLNARWNEAVRIALEKYGVRLYITGDVDGLGGWNGYRPFDAQVRYKNHYGRFAAGPGGSSHGGRYQGREVFAVDVANWQMLAPGNDALAWARFVAIMRAVGLTVDFVTPREQWHIGDFNDPWSAPVFGSLTINPATTNRPAQPEGEDIMLIRWNESHVFSIARESVHYIGSGKELAALSKLYGPAKDVGNDELTAVLLDNNVHWDAVDATLRSAAYGPDRRYWSRLTAEGIAIRGAQAEQSKALADVLATAKSIGKNG